MLSFFLCLIITFVLVLLYNHFTYDTTKGFICLIFSLFGSTALCILFIVAFVSNFIIADALHNKYLERYNDIQYKLHNTNIRDEFGIMDKSFVDEVQYWNEDFIEYKIYSDNLWTNWFYPKKIIKNMDKIQLEETNFERSKVIPL